MKRFGRHLKSIYVHQSSFWVFGGVVCLMVLGALSRLIFGLAVFAAAAFILLLIFDYILLYFRGGYIESNRIMAEKLSVGDDNPIKLAVVNGYRRDIQVIVVEDLPFQLQLRNFSIREGLETLEEKTLRYTVRPTNRGSYDFGDTNLFVSTSLLGLIQRRFVIEQKATVPVFPSLIHMKEIELKSISKIALNQGVKKMRRLGHSYEFEQIKTYVQGDDYRSINWKATARHQGLMINQYEDEKSQPIYFAIDKGRNMRMPFNGLSLVDYSVNSTLAISNVALQKSDRVGLLTFDNEFGSFIKAENKRGQLSLILNQLYNLQQSDVDPNFQALYQTVKRQVRQRSLIFLFTNCHTMHSLQRIKPVLSLLGKQHLLVTILFENSEISTLAAKKPTTVEEIYENTIAEKAIYEQQLIASDLNSLGIQTIVSKPEDLSINTINKYLELKSQGKV